MSRFALGAVGMRAAVFALSIVIVSATHAAAAPTDAQVAQAVIKESLDGYAGNCPCPYDIDRRGLVCGRRSAYSRPGGYVPICYPAQISPAMIADFRRRHGM